MCGDSGITLTVDCATFTVGMPLDRVVKKHLSFNKPTILLECSVEREEYKGKPKYAYRTHPLVKLQAVPQLVRWELAENGTSIIHTGSLVEGDCASSAKLREFMQRASA